MNNVNVVIISDDYITEEKLDITRSWLASLSRPAGSPTTVSITSIDASKVQNFSNYKDDVAKSDQIWLFGYRGSEPAYPELTAAITERMKLGCGVFATGDHDSRGRALCGDIPRVRQLRRWHSSGTSPATDNAPQFGEESMNTLFFALTNEDATFGNYGKENDIQFKPVFANRTSGGTHQLMRLGEKGTIAWLPDHAHEGSLDLGKAPVLSDFDESEQAGIQTVAWAMAWRTPTGGIARERPRAIEIVRAYDPPPTSNRGRIVVDSTFHHWLNENLSTISEKPVDSSLRVPFGHWQAYAANIFEYLLPRNLRAGAGS